MIARSPSSARCRRTLPHDTHDSACEIRRSTAVFQCSHVTPREATSSRSPGRVAVCSFQRTLVKEATAKAPRRAAGQKQTRVIWAEHPSPVAATDWESGVLPAKVPDTRTRQLRPARIEPIAAPSRWYQKLTSGVPARRQGPRPAPASPLAVSTSSTGS